jgi:hypothetical protein
MLTRDMLRQRQCLAAEPDPSPEQLDEDEPVEEEQLTDEQFFRQLRADVEDVRAGLVPAGSEDLHPVPQQRPFSPRTRRNR